MMTDRRPLPCPQFRNPISGAWVSPAGFPHPALLHLQVPRSSASLALWRRSFYPTRTLQPAKTAVYGRSSVIRLVTIGKPMVNRMPQAYGLVPDDHSSTS
jgi:hypothetical protein